MILVFADLAKNIKIVMGSKEATTKAYYDSLPRKIMSAGILILNEKDEILVVKPSYKDHWSIAGGMVNEYESPKTACLREVEEEIGLKLNNIEFLCVNYLENKKDNRESLQFVFYGGQLNAGEINKIKIDNKEIIDYKFLNLKEALTLLTLHTGIMISEAFNAWKNKKAVYIETIKDNEKHLESNGKK